MRHFVQKWKQKKKTAKRANICVNFTHSTALKATLPKCSKKTLVTFAAYPMLICCVSCNSSTDAAHPCQRDLPSVRKHLWGRRLNTATVTTPSEWITWWSWRPSRSMWGFWMHMFGMMSYILRYVFSCKGSYVQYYIYILRGVKTTNYVLFSFKHMCRTCYAVCVVLRVMCD